MRNFFKSELENLHIKTGLLQYFKLSEMTDADGNPDGERQLKLLLDTLVQVCEEFSYIPDNDKKRIIQQAILRDTDYTGINPRQVWKWLNLEKGKYFKEEAHRPMESNTKPVTYDELKPEIKEQVDAFMQSLQAPGKYAMPEVSQEEIDAIKLEDLEIQEGKKGSGYIPNPELVILHQKKIEWMRKYFDPVTKEKKEDWISLEEYIKTDKI